MKKIVKGFCITFAVCTLIGGAVGVTEEVTKQKYTGTTTEVSARTFEPVKEEKADIQEGFSREEQEAYEAAVHYMETWEGSPSSLKGNLIFDGFSRDAARKAVDALKVDWQKNAYKTANRMLNDYQLSKTELFGMLVSEGFTKKQANKAVDKVFK